MGGILEGIEVVDLSSGIAGAMATMLLADHGASVVVVEPPGGRRFTPWGGRRVWLRGKRSVVIDPADERALVLAAAADVVVDDGGLLADGDLPDRVIHCSITGYGPVRAHAGRPARDALVAARLGMQWDQRGVNGGQPLHIAGLVDVEEEGAGGLEVPPGAEQTGHRDGPIYLAIPWASVGAALTASLGISAALYARERTGRGSRVETSLLQGALVVGAPTWQRVPDPRTPGYRMAYFDRRHPKGLYRCADGTWLFQWAPMEHDFVAAIAAGAPAEEAATLGGRSRGAVGYDEDLSRQLERHPVTAAHFLGQPRDWWIERFAAANKPAQPIRSPEEGLLDPIALAEGATVEVPDPDEGPTRQVGVVYRFSETPGAVRGPAPAAGADTAAVLAAVAAGGDGAPAGACGAGRPPHGPGVVPAGGALEGVRVVDLGTAMAGPYGPQLLGDLGAEVIKVNNPAERHGPVSSPVLACNRGKRSLAVDLKDERGREVLDRLLAGTDVVHHNLRTGVAERLGFGWAQLHARHPGLVYCHTRGFEAAGRRVGLPGNDQVAQALTGTWWELGACAAGRPPCWNPSALGDFGNGAVSAAAVIQALFHRRRTGRGQFVDTSIENVGYLYNSFTWAHPDGSGPPRARLDADQLGFDAFHRLYRTADGWLCVSADTAAERRALAAAVAPDRPGAVAPDRSGADRFADGAELAGGFADRADGLADGLADAFAGGTTAAWCEALERAGVPCEASTAGWPRRMFDDPDMIAGGIVVSRPHPTLGSVEQAGHLVTLSGTPGRIGPAAPLVGEHSREILAELGYRDDDVEALVGAGVVHQAEADVGAPAP